MNDEGPDTHRLPCTYTHIPNTHGYTHTQPSTHIKQMHTGTHTHTKNTRIYTHIKHAHIPGTRTHTHAHKRTLLPVRLPGAL